VLGGLLDYSEAEIDDLHAKDVIGNWDHYRQGHDRCQLLQKCQRRQCDAGGTVRPRQPPAFIEGHRNLESKLSQMPTRGAAHLPVVAKMFSVIQMTPERREELARSVTMPPITRHTLDRGEPEAVDTS